MWLRSPGRIYDSQPKKKKVNGTYGRRPVGPPSWCDTLLISIKSEDKYKHPPLSYHCAGVTNDATLLLRCTESATKQGDVQVPGHASLSVFDSLGRIRFVSPPPFSAIRLSTGSHRAVSIFDPQSVLSY